VKIPKETVIAGSNPVRPINYNRKGKTVDKKLKELKERVAKFHALELPGQPKMMHMGTNYLVDDLLKELIKRSNKENFGVKNDINLQKSFNWKYYFKDLLDLSNLVKKKNTFDFMQYFEERMLHFNKIWANNKKSN